MIWNVGRAVRDAEIVLAALGQTQASFQLGGDLALHLHGVLRRQAVEITLTTPQAYDPVRITGVAAAALRQLGYEVQAEQAAGPGLLRALHIVSPGSGPQAEAPPVRLVLSRMPQYTPPVLVQGLVVSSMATCTIQTLQQAMSRVDARDYIDLTLQEQHWGQMAFTKLAARSLEAEAPAGPQSDLASPYLLAHRSLTLVKGVTQLHFRAYGVTDGQAEQIRTQVQAMAERIWAARPQPTSSTGGLQQLSGLSEQQRAALAARLAQPGVSSELLARLASQHPRAPRPDVPPPHRARPGDQHRQQPPPPAQGPGPRP
ncbi:hypothetical protein [Streptomyces sp. NPDC059994]|uniref:hypothetical protein n=1 Tax=Streptomyces sp. NPDC059994 TaxID=3347029 RepID=UPI0036A030BD